MLRVVLRLLKQSVHEITDLSNRSSSSCQPNCAETEVSLQVQPMKVPGNQTSYDRELQKACKGVVVGFVVKFENFVEIEQKLVARESSEIGYRTREMEHWMSEGSTKKRRCCCQRGGSKARR
ncbi:hypothetical protein Tco_0652494 [Tanacetum coccineum]|uniref:Uncharacterized protein n=1 Tax=Tanacetum coccineum TaxID=301880 RepID=A0ABQ4WY50_9ASTR